MDPQAQFCPNPECASSGQIGKGNIGVHSRKQRRYKCHVCKKTFSARQRTPFFRRKKDEDLIRLVVTLMAWGCPIIAIVKSFDLDRRTVRAWLQASGQHCQGVHEHLVEQPRALMHVQADELRVKLQGALYWMAMALQVGPRLWLGGIISPQRDGSLIQALARRVRRCAKAGPLLLVSDGLVSYLKAWRRAFRDSLRTGQPGRPRWLAWKDLVIGQVVKRYQKRRLRAVEQRLVQGGQPLLQRLLQKSQGGQGLNTAFIERLNGTFRARLQALVRKTRGLFRRSEMLQAGMFLIGTVYNFCSEHDSLTLPDRTRRTPAMAAGIVDHCWTMDELLHYRVPTPRWSPPKRRGRPSKELQRLIQEWCE